MFKYTLIGKTYQLIKSIFNYFKVKSYIKDTLYSNEFKFILKKYLKVNIKKDWIGRLYGIINPIVDINGNLDINNVIIELDDFNTNNDEYIHVWIHKQLKLVADLFKINQLYDYINLTLKKVGPKELDNYLLVFDIVARKEMAINFKKWIKHLIVYIILIVTFFITNAYIHLI